MRYFDKSDGVYQVKNGRRTLLNHSYVVNAVVEDNVLVSGNFLSGITTVIHETSGAGGLIQWAADMVVEYINAKAPKLWFEEDAPLISKATGNEYIGDFYIVSDEMLDEARLWHRNKKEMAGEKGTDLHSIAENYIKECIEKHEGNAGLAIDPERYPNIGQFMQWAVDNKVRFIASEKKMWNAELGIAGTCDFVAEIGGKTYIGDIKTFPKMHTADPFIQMGGYALMYPDKIDGTLVVKICDPSDPRLAKYKTQPFAVYERNAVEEDKEMFLTRLKMYRYNENFISPKN